MANFIFTQKIKKEFTPGGLMIRVAGGKSNERVWHYGEAPRDLLGTARTLDEADGAIPLEHGILSKNGFSLIDDSKTMALKSDQKDFQLLILSESVWITEMQKL